VLGDNLFMIDFANLKDKEHIKETEEIKQVPTQA
jgi:hypothetical protein